jgi:hypothetical protein
MSQDPSSETHAAVVKAESFRDGALSLDWIVTAVAFLATLSVILLSPF